eukprot:695449-Prymnesium_polylepis.1
MCGAEELCCDYGSEELCLAAAAAAARGASPCALTRRMAAIALEKLVSSLNYSGSLRRKSFSAAA